MRSPRRGEIYRLRTDSVGKPRPVVIVSPVHLNGGIYVSAVPFYSHQLEKRQSLRTCVYFESGDFGLDKDCVAKTDEVSLYKISERRIAEGAVGTVDSTRMEEISRAICFSLGIDLLREIEED